MRQMKEQRGEAKKLFANANASTGRRGRRERQSGSHLP